MKQTRLDGIFEHQGYGVAWFSPELELVRCSLIFEIFSRSSTVDPGSKIGDVIPETVGMEETLQNLKTGKEKSFCLENINRKWLGGKKLFFNVCFYAFDDPQISLVCLVKEVTEEGYQVREIKQQEYESRLLEGLSDSRRTVLSEKIIGESEPMVGVREWIDKISLSNTKTIHLQGETGTGKNLAAKMIHQSSKDPNVPFIEINLAAIPEDRLESELFGYEAGAFSGATASKRGLIEDADGGFLFLDEIGELSLNMQAKLLSFLDTGQYRRLGSHTEKDVKICLISATNRNLEELVKSGKFREDLLLRLNVLKVILPPLRDLGDDVLAIASHFVDVYNVELKKNVQGFTGSAEELLRDHNWPGNVRELANCVEGAMIFADKDRIDSDDLILHIPKSENN